MPTAKTEAARAMAAQIEDLHTDVCAQDRALVVADEAKARAAVRCCTTPAGRAYARDVLGMISLYR